MMDRRSQIPSVDRLLAHPLVEPLLARWARAAVVAVVRGVLGEARATIAGGGEAPEADALADAVAQRFAALDRPGPRWMINATGVVVHTNLGRAPLAAQAAERVAFLASHYNDLEFDVERGVRGSRQSHAAPWLEALFPGHAALAVNNNAAAVMLALNTLAMGKGVAISRGELVEIGGSFRVPEILERSGARLVEIGTTNRTHLRDYEAVAGSSASLILKVWPSNYRIVGFTKSVGVRELAELAARAGVPLLVDQGCGRLFRDAAGPDSELSVEELLEDGADLVCFSGDKMLGGPQAGILVGKPELVRACAKNPLARALRLDKMTLAALSLTLRAWLAPDAGRSVLPVPRMLSLAIEELERRARSLAAAIADRTPGLEPEVRRGVSRVGGGAAPEEDLPTWIVALRAPGGSADRALARLRRHDPPVVARIEDERIVLDPRTLQDGEDAIVVAALASLVAGP